MNITLKATNTELTQPLKQAVHDKLTALDKFLKPEEKVHVELENRSHEDGKQYRAEIHISPHGHYADATGEDFFEALDLVIPKVLQQMRREKRKKISLRKKFGRLFKRSGQ